MYDSEVKPEVARGRGPPGRGCGALIRADGGTLSYVDYKGNKWDKRRSRRSEAHQKACPTDCQDGIFNDFQQILTNLSQS